MTAKERTILEIDLKPTTLEQLRDYSSLIVEGVIQDVFSVNYQDVITKRNGVYTDNLLEVLKVLKGELPEEKNQLTIRALGGETEDLSLQVPAAPKFLPNERVIVLLSEGFSYTPTTPVESIYQVMGWHQGKFSIVGNLAVPTSRNQPIPISNLESLLKS